LSLRNINKSAHVAFGRVPEIYDPVDVVVVIGNALEMIDAKVMEIRDIQHIIAAQQPLSSRACICLRRGIDGDVRYNLALHDRDQSS